MDYYILCRANYLRLNGIAQPAEWHDTPRVSVKLKMQEKGAKNTALTNDKKSQL